MSNLPQRKKTPEEIAKIRESMGLGGPAPAEPSPAAPAEQTIPVPAPIAPPAPAEPVAPAPATAAIPAVPIPVPAAPSAMPEMPATEPKAPSEPKQVKSLRKSERGPATTARPQPVAQGAASHLPTHRRDEFELNQLRRTQAFSVESPAVHLIAQTVNPFVAGIGYASVFLGAVLPFVDHLFADVPLYIPAAFCVIGLAVAIFIFLKKKRSLHHAGFIAAIAILTLIFGALYYFPHLRNAP